MPLGFKSGKIQINPDCVRITKCNAQMVQLAASFMMEAMVVVLMLMVFVVKVSKFQKQIFLFSFKPKDEQNYFFIFALASKNGSNEKDTGCLLY